MRGAKLHAAVAGLAVWTLLGGGVHAALGYANDWTDGGITWYFDASPEYEGITDWGDIALSPVPNYVILTRFSYKSADVVSNLTIPPAVLWSFGDGALVHDTQPFLRVIQGGAFTNCAPLRNVTIPELVFKIGVPCFWGCSNLTNITKQSSSSGYQYTSRNGVLYSSTTAGQVLTGLTKYPEGKEGNYFEVPSSITNLQAGCLANTKLAVVRFTGEKPMCSDSAFTNSQFIGYCPESWGFEWGQTWNGIKMYPIPTGDVTSDGVTYRYEIRDAVAWCYTVTNGGARVTGRGVVPPALRGRVAVPVTLGGYPVTDIGDYAVAECPLTTGATVPASVTNVGQWAFATNLFDTATVPGVGVVDGWVMDGRGASGHVDLSSMRGLAHGDLFAGNTNTFSVVLPKGQRFIDGQLFSRCTGLETVSIPDGVERIGASAFYGCGRLGEIVIPDSVQTIGSNAFTHCTGLGAAVIGDGAANIKSETFAYCGNLTNVSMGAGVTRIGERAFMGCTALREIDLGKGVTDVGDSAFEGAGLTRLVIPDSVTNTGARAFFGAPLEDVAVGNGLTNLNSFDFYEITSLFYTNTTLRRVKIGNGVTNLWLFGCINLESLAFGTGVTDISLDYYGWLGESRRLAEISVPEEHPVYASENGVLFSKDKATLLMCPRGKAGEYGVPAGTKAIAESAFRDCGGLTALNLPEGLESIGDFAFNGCSGVSRMTIPDSVESDDLSMAFDGCRALEAIEVGEGNRKWRSADGVLFNKAGTLLLRCPEGKAGEYAVPNGVVSIGESAFADCAGLRSVTLPAGMTTISGSAFAGCMGLAEMTVPKEVTTIGAKAFSGCTALRRVELPEGLRGLAEAVFADCVSLQSVSLPPGMVSIGRSAFSGCAGLTELSVPEGVTAIGAGAFSGCTGLRRVELPEGLVGVASEAFEDCGNLRSLFLPRGAKTVGTGAFEGSGLRWIVVPDALAAKTGNWGLPEGCEVIPWGEWAERRTADGVPYEWLWEHGGRTAAEAGDWAAAAAVSAANGRTLGECWVAGLDPAEAGDDLNAELSFEDGVLKVGPKGEKKEGRVYRVEGKRKLTDEGEWEDVTDVEDLGAGEWRFFRMRVGLEE